MSSNVNLSNFENFTVISINNDEMVLNMTPTYQVFVNTSARSVSTSGNFQFQIPFYMMILMLSIIGNLLVITTLVQNRRMRTVTNVFLLNLALSDILVGVLCVPFTLVGTILRDFIFGELLCKLIPFLQGKFGFVAFVLSPFLINQISFPIYQLFAFLANNLHVILCGL